MSTIKNQVLERIESLPERKVFIAKDFIDIGHYETIRKTLNRLAQEGKIRKLGKALYDKPEYSEILKQDKPPSIPEVALAIARKHDWEIAPSQNAALNALGLSTQVSAKWVFVSTGHYQDYLIKNTVIHFKHSSAGHLNPNISMNNRLIIQALIGLGKENVTTKELKFISNQLNASEKESLYEETRQLKGWIPEAVKEMTQVAYAN